MRLTEASLAAGSMTLLDVLHAQSVLAQARLRLGEGVVRYDQAQVRLLGALGLLHEGVFGVVHEDGAPALGPERR